MTNRIYVALDTPDLERAKAIAARGPVFTNLFVVADGDHAGMAWNLTTADGALMCGMEMFRVREGRLAEAWNHPLTNGQWL